MVADRFSNLDDLVGTPIDGVADLAFDFFLGGHTHSFLRRSTITIAAIGCCCRVWTDDTPATVQLSRPRSSARACRAPGSSGIIFTACSNSLSALSHSPRAM